MEGVDSGGEQGRYVVEAQAAADQDALLVARFPAQRRLAEQRGEAVVDAFRGTGGEVGVQAGQVRELLAQGVAVGGAVDRAVERPGAAVQFGDDPLDGVQVDAAVRVEEPEDELVGAGVPQPPATRTSRFTSPAANPSARRSITRRSMSTAARIAAKVSTGGVSPSAAMSVTTSRRSAPPAWAAIASSAPRAITSRTARVLIGPLPSCSLERLQV